MKSLKSRSGWVIKVKLKTWIHLNGVPKREIKWRNLDKNNRRLCEPTAFIRHGKRQHRSHGTKKESEEDIYDFISPFSSRKRYRNCRRYYLQIADLGSNLPFADGSDFPVSLFMAEWN